MAGTCRSPSLKACHHLANGSSIHIGVLKAAHDVYVGLRWLYAEGFTDDQNAWLPE